MAAYVQSIATWTTTNGTKTAAITPAVNGLLVVFVANTGNVATPTLTDDQSGTYANITSALKATSADLMFVFVRNQLVASAVAHTLTMTPGTTTGGGLVVIEISGLTRTGAAAAKQSQVQANQAAAATPAPVFGASALTGNPTLGAVFNATNPATMTPPTSWTERQDLGYATPAAGIEVVTRDSGFTGTTITWGGTSASAFCDISIELDTSAAPVVAALPLPVIVRQAVSRAVNW